MWVRRHPIATVALGLVVAAGVAVGVLWRLAGSSDPVTTREALAEFRSAGGGTAATAGPRSGVYVYSASGSERGGAGPFAITRNLPSVARLVVTPSGGGWESELSYSRQHVEGARYVLGDGGYRVTWRRTKVTFAGFGRDDRRTVDPPSLLVSLRPRVGMRWSETFRTGDLVVRADNRVLRREDLDVGGRRVATFVISSRSLTSGPHPGTRDETVWWSPELRLPVRWDVDMDIRGTFAFRARSRLLLESAVPQV